MQITIPITIEIHIDHQPEDPAVGFGPAWTVEGVEVPCFTAEQEETLWRSLRADMEDSLIEYAQEYIKNHEEAL